MGVPRNGWSISSRVCWKYDCTHIESLFSTYPYLTYSNKKTTSPVMTINSTVGLREKISIDTKVDMLWRRAETRNHSSCFPSLHFEQAPSFPPPPPSKNLSLSPFLPPPHYNHKQHRSYMARSEYESVNNNNLMAIRLV